MQMERSLDEVLGATKGATTKQQAIGHATPLAANRRRRTKRQNKVGSGIFGAVLIHYAYLLLLLLVLRMR